MALVRFCGLFLALLGTSARADIGVDYRPLPSGIAGTLAPFVLSLDGKVIFRSTERYSGIELNGAKVPVKKDKARAFFLKAAQDTLHVVTTDGRGATQVSQDVYLPRVETVELEQSSGQWIFTIGGAVREVLIDGKNVPYRDGVAKWFPPKGAGPDGRPHLMEIHGPSGEPDRFYNIQITMKAKPAAAKAPPKPKPRAAAFESSLLLAGFQAGVLGLFRSGASSSLSAELCWAPLYLIAHAFGLRGNFGITPLARPAGGRFLAIEAEVLLSYHVGPNFIIEGGGGSHIWPGNGGAMLSASAIIAALVGDGDSTRLYAGYTNLFAAGSPWLLKFGVGFSF